MAQLVLSALFRCSIALLLLVGQSGSNWGFDLHKSSECLNEHTQCILNFLKTYDQKIKYLRHKNTPLKRFNKDNLAFNCWGLLGDFWQFHQIKIYWQEFWIWFVKIEKNSIVEMGNLSWNFLL